MITLISSKKLVGIKLRDTLYHITYQTSNVTKVNITVTVSKNCKTLYRYLQNQDINHDWNLGIQTQNVISNPDIRVLVCYVDPQSPIMIRRISLIRKHKTML